MKKISIAMTIILTFVIILSGCGAKEESDNRTLDDFITAYTDKGVDVTDRDEPAYSAIGAVDGSMFYMDGQPVKIYEYKLPGALKSEQKDTELIKDWDTNGKFLLETSSGEATDIFKSVK